MLLVGSNGSIDLKTKFCIFFFFSREKVVDAIRKGIHFYNGTQSTESNKYLDHEYAIADVHNFVCICERIAILPRVGI